MAWGELKVWDARTRQEVLTLKGHRGMVSSVCFSPDGKRIASGSGGQKEDSSSPYPFGEVKLWDATTGELLKTLRTHMGFLPGHKGLVYQLAFSPDGKSIASESTDGTRKVWEAQTGEGLQSLEWRGWFQADSGISCGNFSPDGKHHVLGRYDGTLSVRELDIGRPTRTFKGHTRRVTRVTFSPDGKRIASVSSRSDKEPDTARSEVKVWDAATGQPISTFTGHAGVVTMLSFSPDGKWIASVSEDRMLMVWDVQTGQLKQAFQGHLDQITSVVFSPDGNSIITGSADRTVKVWYTDRKERTGTEKKPIALKGHTDWVYGLAFSADGKHIISSSADRTIRRWDLAEGEEPLSIEGHTGGVNSVGLSPDGKRIVSGSNDSSVRVWNGCSLPYAT